MIEFLKANIASLIASFFDYILTIMAVQIFGMNVVLASFAGNVFGGIVNFMLGRNWVFSAQQSGRWKQASRYFIVWIGNLLLNSSGMYLFTKTSLYYITAKIITSIAVAVGYNYPLQKRYVFKKKRIEYDAV